MQCCNQKNGERSQESSLRRLLRASLLEEIGGFVQSSINRRGLDKRQITESDRDFPGHLDDPVSFASNENTR